MFAPVVPEVAAPAFPADGVRSSTGAPPSLVGVLEHAASTVARIALMISLCICPPESGGGGRCGQASVGSEQTRILDQGFLGSGPHAGSRTSLAAAVNRCLTRPSLETAANIPRPPTSDA